jgi:hypothetical protein
LYFEDREPIGPYRVEVAAWRTRRLRGNDFAMPEPAPRDTSYASVIRSSVPISVQHTRLDLRDPRSADDDDGLSGLRRRLVGEEPGGDDAVEARR